MTKLRLLTKNLLDDLKRLTTEGDTIYWMTAFMMKSGVNEVLPALRDASLRGADIKILTGDYLSITQPDALQLLLEGLPIADCRTSHDRKWRYILPSKSVSIQISKRLHRHYRIF
nr:hypothetical protein [Sporosarcina sp. P20a]